MVSSTTILLIFIGSIVRGHALVGTDDGSGA
jgi:hypothetical protein